MDAGALARTGRRTWKSSKRTGASVSGRQGIRLCWAMRDVSHNVDFTTYSRTGVFWRGGLLHSVSGVSYWTLRRGIVGHLRPYANNGRILLVNPFQSSRSTFYRGSLLSFFAFKEGMLGTPISVLGPPVANGQFVAVRERSCRVWFYQGPITQGFICICYPKCIPLW